MTGERRGVAAFDFDGTLSYKDSLGPFLQLACGRARVYRALAARAPVLAGVAAGIRDRDAEKERLVGRLLAGRAADEIHEVGESYARRLRAGDALRPEMLERVAWHHQNRHDVVIVSASLDVYLEPLAPLLGIDHVLCTQLGVGPDDRLDGTLVRGNVRGPEKLTRLRAWMGDDDIELWAYGDSAGDRELLAAADHPHRIRRRGR